MEETQAGTLLFSLIIIIAFILGIIALLGNLLYNRPKKEKRKILSHDEVAKIVREDREKRKEKLSMIEAEYDIPAEFYKQTMNMESNELKENELKEGDIIFVDSYFSIGIIESFEKYTTSDEIDYINYIDIYGNKNRILYYKQIHTLASIKEAFIDKIKENIKDKISTIDFLESL